LKARLVATLESLSSEKNWFRASKNWFQAFAFNKFQLVPPTPRLVGPARVNDAPADLPVDDIFARPPANAIAAWASSLAVGKYVLINRSTYQVKPFYLSSETVIPIK
jgi:hypothetical protein